MISAAWLSNLPSVPMALEPSLTNAGTAYVDRLTSASVRSMLADGVSRIIVLEALDYRQRKHVAALNRKGVKVEEGDFFLGHLKNPDGESVYLASRRVAGRLALEAAALVIDAQPLLKELNAKYGRETLRLSLAKDLLGFIQKPLDYVYAARALAYPIPPRLWLAGPARFSGCLLERAVPDVQFNFYPATPSRISLVLVHLVKHLGKHVNNLCYLGRTAPAQRDSLPGVLMVQEDSIRADQSLRGQPHWLNANATQQKFRTFIANFLPYLEIAGDVKKFSNSALEFVSRPSVRAAWGRRKMSAPLRRLAEDGRALRRTAFRQQGFEETAALLSASRLFMDAERLGALAAYLNIKVFVTHQLSSDPIQLVAKEMKIRTIAFQYSNLGMLSPLMMSTCDCYVIFSDMYKAILEHDGIGPKQWRVVGYIHDRVAAIVRDRARKHRDGLCSNGAEFIVCYFDESVQHDKWGLVSKSDHLAEIHLLAKSVLEDSSFGVILKSQFLVNTPSRLYPHDVLIQSAKATGRYLELTEGKHRNDIYPAEAALAADICISHKFGATAALEAACAGMKVVLLDSYGCRTAWDAIYSNVSIEYRTISEALEAIKRYRSGCQGNQALGDWTPILDRFDPYIDGRATARLLELIEQSANDATAVV
jgi:hypothetical protein